MDKIWLVDTNPLKTDKHQNWLCKVKQQKKISDVNPPYLMAGLTEARQNLALLKQPNIHTIKSTSPEFKNFYESIKNTKKDFMIYIDIHKESLNGVSKTNMKLLENILMNLEAIQRTMQDTHYDFSKHKNHNFFYELVDENIVRKHNKGQYREADRLLTAGPLIRASEGLETFVLTPDSGIKEIAYESLSKIKVNGTKRFYEPSKLIQKITFINSYNGLSNLREW